MQKLKSRFRYKYAFAAAIFVIAGGSAILVLTDKAPKLIPEAYGVKSKDIQVIGDSEDKSAKLGDGQTEKIIESKVVKADFQFNAIAPHWKETNATDSNRKLEIRASLDKKDWSPWLEIEASGPLREDEPHPDRVFAETPLLIDGKYFQYKISLNRESADKPSPEIYDLKLSQIDSRKPKSVVVAEKIKDFFDGSKAYAAQQHPRIISRAEWGSVDPNGNYFKGTTREWPTSYSPVKQVFLHHTVTASYQPDPSAAVRAIWDFQANTRGWGDVGYNYLMDYQGNVYEGRLGGDNVVGAHVLGYNRGSMGVALLGCFQSGDATCQQLNGSTGPPNAVLQERLTNFLGYKTAGYEINPNTTHSFCDSNNQNCLNLWTITGHRDAGQTSCPGDLTYNSLKNIRDNTAPKKNGGWTYSAKQLSYSTINLSTNDNANVTLNFKNTGTATWSRTSNPMSLYTMNPPGKTSPFQGSSWLSNQKPALLNEASVAPGQTGSFTLNIKRPNLPTGDYTEYFTLITQNGNTPGTYFGLPISFNCTIGQPSNPRANGLLIRDIGNGKVYLLQEGEKRYVTSLAAAGSNRFNLNNIVDVYSAEVNTTPSGDNINLAEGTLIKSPSSSKVYVIDSTPGGDVRRSINSGSTFSSLGMRPDQVRTVSQAVVNSYSDGPAVTGSSDIPDGRLVKSPSSHRVYFVIDGQKRWVPSIVVFDSQGFNAAHISSVSQAKIDNLLSGNNLSLRAGTLVKTSNSPTIYVIDSAGGTDYRRLITTPSAFNESGFRSGLIKTISPGVMNGYTISAKVECFK